MGKKKLVSILSTLWLSLTNKNKIVTETLTKVEPLIIQSKVKSTEKEETKTINKQLQHLINELNELQVYILVTVPFKNDKKEDIFLSLMSEARLDSEQYLIDYKYRKLILTRASTQPLTNILKKDRYSVSEILRSNRFPVHAKTYRNAKSYCVENSFGYKSICPIFFDKMSAENFLIKSSREAILLLRNMPLRSNKQILKGFLNTKIKTIGLGDLIQYLSNKENEIIFNKVEFLFVPYINELESLSKINKRKIENIIKKKNFAFYHQEFLKIQKN